MTEVLWYLLFHLTKFVVNRLNGFPGVEPHAGGVVLSCVWEGKMGGGVGWRSKRERIYIYI